MMLFWLCTVGLAVGLMVGKIVGFAVGVAVGSVVGFDDGEDVGACHVACRSGVAFVAGLHGAWTTECFRVRTGGHEEGGCTTLPCQSIRRP